MAVPRAESSLCTLCTRLRRGYAERGSVHPQAQRANDPQCRPEPIWTQLKLHPAFITSTMSKVQQVYHLL